jgi:hypothetical protein
VNRELQLTKETNVALATEKLEQKIKIYQLEFQLNGKVSMVPDDNRKLPFVLVTPIGGKGKVVDVEDLLNLSEWLSLVHLLEQAYRWHQQVFFLLANV